MTSITIPESVATIDNLIAFWGCTELKEIHSRNPTPPSFNGTVNISGWNKVYYPDGVTCKLYVPYGTYSRYWFAPFWGSFKQIIEEGGNSINVINKENISIYPVVNGILVATDDIISVKIYNSSGQEVYNSVVNGNTEIRLDKGVYIVRVRNESEKVVVK